MALLVSSLTTSACAPQTRHLSYPYLPVPSKDRRGRPRGSSPVNCEVSPEANGVNGN